MKKNKINGKQIKLIINIISLGIFMFSYFYLYENYVDKTERNYLEVEKTKAAILDREKKLQEEESVKEQIVEVNAEKQKIIDSFPVYIGDEDNFMFVEQMEEALNVKTSSVTPSDNVEFFKTILPAKGEDTEVTKTAGTTATSGTEENSNTSSEDTVTQDQNNTNTDQQAVMTATVSTLGMSFITDYKGFKDMMNYIGKYPDHTIIDSVSVSADNMTGVLAGNLVLKRFALTGTGKEYQAPTFDDIDIGMDNIFGEGNGTEIVTPVTDGITTPVTEETLTP